MEKMRECPGIHMGPGLHSSLTHLMPRPAHITAKPGQSMCGWVGCVATPGTLEAWRCATDHFLDRPKRCMFVRPPVERSFSTHGTSCSALGLAACTLRLPQTVAACAPGQPSQGQLHAGAGTWRHGIFFFRRWPWLAVDPQEGTCWLPRQEVMLASRGVERWGTGHLQLPWPPCRLLCLSSSSGHLLLSAAVLRGHQHWEGRP